MQSGYVATIVDVESEGFSAWSGRYRSVCRGLLVRSRSNSHTPSPPTPPMDFHQSCRTSGSGIGGSRLCATARFFVPQLPVLQLRDICGETGTTDWLPAVRSVSAPSFRALRDIFERLAGAVSTSLRSVRLPAFELGEDSLEALGGDRGLGLHLLAFRVRLLVRARFRSVDSARFPSLFCLFVLSLRGARWFGSSSCPRARRTAPDGASHRATPPSGALCALVQVQEHAARLLHAVDRRRSPNPGSRPA